MRRTHLTEHTNIHKRQLIHLAAFNLGLVMRQLLGAGPPRLFQGRRRALLALILTFLQRLNALLARLLPFSSRIARFSQFCWLGSERGDNKIHWYRIFTPGC